eukprot:SAG11_NODE_5526_length_1534_cov_17.765157_1_plen_59_part_10
MSHTYVCYPGWQKPRRSYDNFETKILEPHASFYTMVKGLVLVRSNAKGLWSVFGAFLSY